MAGTIAILSIRIIGIGMILVGLTGAIRYIVELRKFMKTPIKDDEMEEEKDPVSYPCGILYYTVLTGPLPEFRRMSMCAVLELLYQKYQDCECAVTVRHNPKKLFDVVKFHFYKMPRDTGHTHMLSAAFYKRVDYVKGHAPMHTLNMALCDGNWPKQTNKVGEASHPIDIRVSRTIEDDYSNRTYERYEEHTVEMWSAMDVDGNVINEKSLFISNLLGELFQVIYDILWDRYEVLENYPRGYDERPYRRLVIEETH